MTRKFIPIFSIILLLVSLIAPGIQPVAAQEKENVEYEDGTYEVPLKILNADKDEASTMQNFVKNGVSSVVVTDGKADITMTMTNAKMIKDFEVNSQKAKIVEENEDKNERTYSFTIKNLNEIVQGKVAVEVPGMYDTTHDIRLQFDTSKLPQVEDSTDDETELDEEVEESEGEDTEGSENSNQEDNETDKEEQSTAPESNDEEQQGNNSEEGKKEENGSEESEEEGKNEGSFDNLADGYYTVEVSYIRSDNDEKSSMGNYLSDTVFIKVGDGHPEITVTITNSDAVTKLEVANTKTIEKLIEGDKRHETFQLDKLSSTVSAYVEYQAPFNGGVYEGNADFRIAFDEATISKVKKSDKPTGKTSISHLADGYYTVGASYLKSESDESSAMGSYLADTAFIQVEDGHPEVTVTINDSETVTKLQVAELTAIEKLVQGNKRHETYQLDQLSPELDAYVEYQAPYGDTIFRSNADFRIAFDEETLSKVKKSDKPTGNTSISHLADGYYTADVSYIRSDSDEKSSMGNYLANTAFIEVKDGNPKLTVTINDNKTVTKLQVADLTAIEKLIQGKKRHETYQLDQLSPELDAYVEYQAPYGGTIFRSNADFRIAFDEKTIKKAKKTDKPTGKPVKENSEETFKEIKSGEKVTVNSKDKVKIKDTKISIEMPTKLPKDTDITVDVKNKDSSIPKGYKIAGAIVDVKVDLEGESKEGKYTLTLPYNKDDYKANEVDIYYYDTKESSWKAQNGKVDSKAGTITVDVDHFSKYGVLAKDKPTQEQEEFELDYTFYQPGTDTESTMNNFKEGPAKIKKDAKGNYIVSMSFINGSMIKNFSINGNEAKETMKDNKIKVLEFPIKDLTKRHKATVSVEVPGLYEETHKVDLVFDEITSNPTPTPEPIPNPNPVIDEGKGKVTKVKQGEKVSDYIFKEMKYTFYKSGTHEKSVMDDFAKGNAIIREHKKNGQRYATLTFTNPEMIKYIKVNGVDANVIHQTKDELVVDFPVKNLKSKQKVKAFIDVPGMYAKEHTVDLVFDTGSSKALSADGIPTYLKDYIEDSSSTTGSNGNGSGVSTNDIETPNFDRDEDGNIIGSNNDNNSSINPKTADLNMTQIILFGSLLLVSLIPLVIKLRRRMVASN